MEKACIGKKSETTRRVSVTDRVFDSLYFKVLSLELAPGTKISEADIAKQLDASRQSVRDAFYRLSILGFLIIKPQSATTVSRISARDVFEARYIRTAIEIENIRNACQNVTPAQLDALAEHIDLQRKVLQKDDFLRFQKLDNEFHNKLCACAGRAFSWKYIEEKKAHTDRVRFLALSFSSTHTLEEHLEIHASLCAADQNRAEAAIRHHLSQIETVIDQLRENNHEWFDD